MIFEHSVDVEGFDADESVLVSDDSALLVQEIRSLIGNLDVTLGYFVDGFSSIHRPLLFSAQPALEYLQPMLGLDQEAWIVDCVSVAQSGEILQADINTYLIFGMRVLPFNLRLAGEESKPLPDPVSFYGEGLDLTLRGSVQNDRYVPYFGDMKSFIGKKLEAGLGVCYGVNPLLESGKTDLNPLACLLFLDSAEEIRVGFRKSISTVLENLRMSLFKLRVGVLDLLDYLAHFGFGTKRCALRFILLFTSLKKRVIQLTAQIKLRIQSPYLLSGRIQSIFVVPQLHYSYLLDSKYINKFAFIPPLKMVGFPVHMS